MTNNDVLVELDLPPVVHPALRTVVFTLLIYALVLLLMFGIAGFGEAKPEIYTVQFDLFWRAVVGIGALLAGFVYLHHRTTTISVTEDQLTKKSGILTENFARVEIDKITNYNYHRSSLELLLGLVDLEIESSGATDVAPGIVMRFITMSDARLIMAKIREGKVLFKNRIGRQKFSMPDREVERAASAGI